METDQQAAPTISRWSGVVRTVGLDIVGPLAVYRLCRAAGLSEVWSLVVSGFPPAIGVFIDWVRWRTLEVVGAVVLGGIAVSLVLALLTDDPSVVLLEGAGLTAAFGVACLASVTRHRPLIFHFAQAFYGGRHSHDGAQMDADYRTYAEARSFWRVVTIIWGITYVAESMVRAVVVQQVSSQTALLFNRTAPWLVYGTLFAGTYWWGSRLRAQKPESDP